MITRPNNSASNQLTTFGLIQNKPSIGYTRPQALQALVNQNYDLQNARTESGYIYIGGPDYFYHFHERIFVNVSATIQEKLTERDDDKSPYCVLDLGAGNFTLTDTMQAKLGDKVKMYGISASDIFRNHNKIIDEYHVINNAENLSSVFVNQEFDLIVSRATFIHLIDKVGSVIEAYKKLKPGGILMIDHLPIPGCESHIQQIYAWLQNMGYAVTCECDNGEMKSFILEKSVDIRLQELVFPVIYDSHSDERGAVYAPHPDIFKISCHENREYAHEVKLIMNAAHSVHAALFQKHNDLPSMFSDIQYQTLSTNKQLDLILAVNEKSINQYDDELTLKNLTEMSKIDYKFRMHVLSHLQIQGGLFLYQLKRSLAECKFIPITPELELSCIQLAAQVEICIRIKVKKTQHALNQLNIPYDAESQEKNLLPHSFCLEKNNSLNFPESAKLAANHHTTQHIKPSRA